ncbi:MAG: 50S ribosomal protein L10 [Verrucomicrobia bacterium]|nr:MAG: 50S ribosomal protein L10 [Verrucomicrobiota bacterium]
MRLEKQSIVNELRGKMQDATFLILTDYKGLNVAAMNELRGKLRDAQAEFHVVQNSLVRLVAKDLGQAGLEPGLTGPSAMISGRGDVARAAKVLRDFIKDKEKPTIKIGALQGAILSAQDVAMLADLPSREQLYGQLVGTLAAPMQRLVGALNQKLASVVYVLKAYQEQKEKAPQA